MERWSLAVPHTPEQVADRLIDVAAGVEQTSASEPERRMQSRVEYDALVAMMIVDECGVCSEPFVVRANDISLGGLSVVSGRYLPAEAQTVVQLVRSDGTSALVGASVRHCRTMRPAEHHIGLAFGSMPDTVNTEDFLDEHGQLRLLDPLLKDNRMPNR